MLDAPRSWLSRLLPRLLREDRSTARVAPIDGTASVTPSELRQRAEQQDAESCYRLSALYETGQQLPQSFADAMHWLRTAAALGHTAAQARLGDIYMTGLQGARSLTQAAEYRLTVADGPDSLLRRLYPDGVTVSADPEQALHWNTLAASAGDPGALARLGYLHARGLGTPTDRRKAHRFFSRAAETHCVAGMLGLGILYAGGYGGRVDEALADTWLSRAAEQGSAPAALCLALLLLNGTPRIRDEVRARHLLTRLADSRDPMALYELGELLRTGRGGAQNLAAAETHYQRAIAAGNPRGHLGLARLLASCGAPDLIAAAHACREAAEAGDEQAQYVLGRLFLSAVGVPFSQNEGRRWLTRAAETGFGRARTAVVSLELEPTGAWLRVPADDREWAEGYAMPIPIGLSGSPTPRAALRELLRTARDGDPEAMLWLATLYAEVGSPVHHPTRATKWYQRASEAGLAALLHEHARSLMAAGDREVDANLLRTLLTASANGGCSDAAWTLYGALTDGTVEPLDAEEAARWLEKSADLGLVDAAVEALHVFKTRKLSPPRRAWLQQVISRIEALDDPRVASAIGLWWLNSGASRAERQRALPWLEKAAGKGIASARVALARVLLEGRLCRVDLKSALHWYELAACDGDLQATESFMALCEGSLTSPESRQRVYDAWQARAENGEVIAARIAGQIALIDARLQPSVARVAEASRWLKQAVQQDDPEAMVALALHLRGTAQPSAERRSLRLLRDAVKLGSADAAYELANIWMRHPEVAALQRRARNLLRLAATRGHVAAHTRLGDLWCGRAESQPAQATEAWRRARRHYLVGARQGEGSSMLALAELLEHGRGGTRDRAGAMRWYRHAARRGISAGKAALRRLAAEGSEPS